MSLAEVSIKVEEERKKDPYYLTSKTLMMGSLLTEGSHYFIDREHKDWKKAFKLLLEKVQLLQDELKINAIMLRDFFASDSELKNLLSTEGFIPIKMPNSNVVEDFTWKTPDELLKKVKSKTSYRIRNEVLAYVDEFTIEVKEHLNEEECSYFYELYENVKNNNIGFNMFAYPRKILATLSLNKNWKFLVLKRKGEVLPAAVSWFYETKDSLTPLVVGMDYSTRKPSVYKQFIYQMNKYAQLKGIDKVYWGFSADFEKRKYGAKQIEKLAYLQIKDNFNLELLEAL